MERALDLLIAAIGLLLSSPLLIVSAFLIRVFLGTPVLLKQARPGLRGNSFIMIKFRTMTDERDDKGDLLPDIKRLTTLGQLLRATSIDELPELVNVLKGEMSIVGPRPLLTAYIDRYTPEQMRRHEVKPGLTGWAQVNGRNAISWEDKFRLDVWYVDHRSFFLDLKILGLTMWKLLKREGINQPGQATAEEFTSVKPTLNERKT